MCEQDAQERAEWASLAVTQDTAGCIWRSVIASGPAADRRAQRGHYNVRRRKGGK